MSLNKNKLDYLEKLTVQHEFIVVHPGKNPETITLDSFKKDIMSSVSVVTGQKGEKGNFGDYGDPGESGDKGAKGFPGERGESGERGRTGFRGEVGQLGSNGQKGDIGQKGTSGIKGDTGATGFQGKLGEKGSKGEKGTRGAFGLRGSSGQIPVLEAEKGQKGDAGDDAVYGRRGERGEIGDRGDRGIKGRTGPRGSAGRPLGDLDHALYGASIFRNWTDLNITSDVYVHLSYFRNNDAVSYKYFRLILEVPSDNNNLLTPTSEIVLNLEIPGEVTKYKPVICGHTPVVWIKDSEDTNYDTPNRSNNRVPRVPYLDYHSSKTHFCVYIPTTNTNYISESKIYLKIKKMFGTNDI